MNTIAGASVLSTDTQFTEGEAVQRSSTGTVEPHTTGDVLGVVMESTAVNETTFATKLYSAGGGGVKMILGTAWDGTPSRFRFVSGRVEPITSGGDGWLIPDYPASPKSAGDVVRGGIYK